jgi:ribosome-binding protein aMBF1 (putative translation factor)
MRFRSRYSERMANRRDFLDEIIDERSERNPEFPDLVEAALRRRQLLRELAARREKLGLSQTLVAARMGTSQSAVARLEAGEIDAKLSTVERFAAALGQKVEWRVGKVRKSAAGSS